MDNYLQNIVFWHFLFFDYVNKQHVTASCITTLFTKQTSLTVHVMIAIVLAARFFIELPVTQKEDIT